VSIWFAIPLVAVLLGLTALAWRRLHPAPRLVIGERGIRQPGRGWGWIPWDEIEGAYPPTVDETETVRLRLRMTRRLSRVLRRRRKPAGQAALGEAFELPLDLAGSELNAVEVLQEILAHTETGDTSGGPSRHA
jgi:hypothetical protein